MAWNNLYYMNFKSQVANDSYQVQLFYTGATVNTEIRGDQNPFIVDYPEAKKFDAVRAAGATLNLISTTDRQFMNLYTNDMLHYLVKLTKNGSMIWTGYLDSELYRENFNAINNYPVSFTANDGFALLSRMNFVDAAGNRYTGLKSEWQILQIILNRLGLPWNYIYVGLSTTAANLPTIASNTILHMSNRICENFYDEDGVPQTLRKVLEAILQPYGASIVQDQGSLFIYDFNTLLTSPASFKKFNSSTYAYISTDSITTNLGDLSTIKFFTDNQQLEILPSINKEVIKYSAYNMNTLNNFSASSSDFSSQTGRLTTVADAQYGWTEYNYNQSKTANYGGIGFFALMKGTGSTNTSSSAYYMKYLATGTNFATSSLNFKVKPFIMSNSISINNCYWIKISCKAYFRTKTREADPTENPNPNIKYAALYLLLRSGNNQTWGNFMWTASASTLTNLNTFKLTYYDDNTFANPISDQWIYNKAYFSTSKKYVDFQLMPLNTWLNSPLQVLLTGAYVFSDKDIGGTDYSAAVKDIRISDLKLEISDNLGNSIATTDVEYTGYLDPKAKNDGQTITLLNGTNTTGFPSQYGSISDGMYPVPNWTRNGNTATIEQLLLNSYLSNYQNPTVKLTADVNLVPSYLGYLTYNTYLSGKKLVPMAISINYADNSNTLTMVESLADNLPFNFL